MSEHCSRDGGFVGECGCTHPNHEHSKLVKGLLEAAAPDFISETDGEAALKEGFFVDSKEDGKIGFGERILSHWNDGKHHPNDIKARKERLAFAIATVKNHDVREINHEGYENRTAYTKAFKKFGVMVVVEPTRGIDVVEAFTYIPDRKKKTPKAKAGIEPVCPIHGKSTTAGVISCLPTAVNDTTSAPKAQGGF